MMKEQPEKFLIADLRQNYTREGLQEALADSNPWKQFQRWLAEAIAAQLPEPNAMTLATVTPEGKASARMVLLKGLDDQGFIFFTNYDSHKGQQLTAKPQAALVFWWAELERQVRIEGNVAKISPAESDEYFQSRPKSSQLGAWVSPQSQVVTREYLETTLAQLQEKYAQQNVPRPPHWGGFRLMPLTIEFWQGRPNRLHDRLHYRLLENGSWFRERLAP